jgi:hypothetical protein
MTVADAFSQSYREAREKFLAAVDGAGLDVHSHLHPLLGRDGEALAMDVVRDGADDADALLLISSGCHGVEGFCGSAVQVSLLRDTAWLDAARRAGVAVLYVHALNPYGFSWWRRTTHENVDLNRNFHVPATWPPPMEVETALQKIAVERGERALQAAISGGQHTHPQGLFYGGVDPCWSNVTLRHVLGDHGGRCKRLGWIDLHTGLGPDGHGERIFACRDEADALARARRWWGDEVTSIDEGSSSSARLSGLMWLSVEDECPQAEYTGIALEYGTLPLREVIDALRADQWLENHPEKTDRALRAAIKRRLRDAFYTDTDAWKQRIVEQAFDCAHQALLGLSGGR